MCIGFLIVFVIKSGLSKHGFVIELVLQVRNFWYVTRGDVLLVGCFVIQMRGFGREVARLNCRADCLIKIIQN